MNLFGFVLFLFGNVLGEKHHQDSYASTLTYGALSSFAGFYFLPVHVWLPSTLIKLNQQKESTALC